MRTKMAVVLAVVVVCLAFIASPTFAEDQAVGPYKDFKGTINLDVRDSKADWGPFTPKKAPAGAPNILFVLYDDTGLAAWSPYGGRINMPTLDKLAQNGLTYTQWHTAALCSPTRSTLLTGRNHTLNGMAAITEGVQRVPRLGRPHPAAGRHTRADPPGQWLQHLLAGQEPQRPGAGCRRGWRPQDVAARPGIRALLRIHRRRDQPVVSRPRRGQPLHRAAVRPGAGLPSLQGSGRSGDQDDPGPEGHQPLEAVVHVLQPGRQSCPAPRPAGVHRQVQGQVRRRLRGLPHLGAGADDREGRHAEGHQADTDQPAAGVPGESGRRRPPVEYAQRRREEAVLAHGRGLCRVLGIHRRADRPRHRLPGEDRAAREHHGPLRRRQRHLRRRHAERFRQREQVLQRLP